MKEHFLGFPVERIKRLQEIRKRDGMRFWIEWRAGNEFPTLVNASKRELGRDYNERKRTS